MGDGEGGGEVLLQRHGAEVGAAGGGLQRLEVEAGAAEQVHRRIALQPALQQQGLRTGGRTHHVVSLALGRDHRGPAVAGGGRLVHDQGGDGAAARGLLELVGPAAVVGHGLAAELAEHGLARLGLEVGVVDQEDGDLAVQVDALEVVPAALGREDAVADEDQRRVVDGHAVHRPHGADVDRLALGERPAADAHGDGAGDVGADQRHRLGPGAGGAAGFELQVAEAVGEVGDGLGLAGRAGGAALEGVGRQHLHRRRHLRGVDGVRRLGRCGGGERSDGGHKGDSLDAPALHHRIWGSTRGAGEGAVRRSRSEQGRRAASSALPRGPSTASRSPSPRVPRREDHGRRTEDGRELTHHWTPYNAMTSRRSAAWLSGRE